MIFGLFSQFKACPNPEMLSLSLKRLKGFFYPSGQYWAICTSESIYDECVLELFSLKFIFLLQGKCTGAKIMLACRPVGASKLTVLAWADRATVFGVTDSPKCRSSCSGHVDKVMFVHLLVTRQENSFFLKSTPGIYNLVHIRGLGVNKSS